MKRLSAWFLLLSAFACVTLAGCSGGSGATVTGTIALDGTPVPDAEVVFEPYDRAQKIGSETVRTDAAGKFEITPHPKKKGLSPGKYGIWVSKWVNKKTGAVPKPEDAEMEKAAGVLRNAIPYAYSNREDVPKLTAEIKAGKNDLGTLDLKSK